MGTLQQALLESGRVTRRQYDDAERHLAWRERKRRESVEAEREKENERYEIERLDWADAQAYDA